MNTQLPQARTKQSLSTVPTFVLHCKCACSQHAEWRKKWLSLWQGVQPIHRALHLSGDNNPTHLDRQIAGAVYGGLKR